MKKQYVFVLVIVLSVSAAVFLMARSFAAPVEDRVPDVENAIIIEGLSMETENVPPDEGEGCIYIDDTFDDNIAGGNGNSRPVKGETSAEILERLRRRDPRWHETSYRVRRGDNLFGIASAYNVSPRLVIRYNDIRKPSELGTGEIIRIPNRQGISHTVAKGDTLHSIAKRYGVKPGDICRLNGIKRDRVLAGTALFIPDARKPLVPGKRPAERETVVAHRREEPADRGRSVAADIPSCIFARPLSGRITSGFGRRINPISGRRGYHCGIDISAEVGTGVRAAAAGTVIFSGWKGGYGNMVVISHDNGYITVYAHNSRNNVSENDTVKQGDIIALSGMTGAVTGAHLHFEIRKYLTPLNPIRMMKQ